MSYINTFSKLDPEVLFFALTGGFLPAIFWLWFWLKEDSERPEPKMMLIITFLGGMAAVILSIALEIYSKPYADKLGNYGTMIYVAIEEIVKFSFAFMIALKSRFDNEPIDPLIYMIATALGFAALENSIFITSSYLDEGVSASVSNGIQRFLGATLLHTAASGSIGLALGLSFYKKPAVKFWFVTIGLITAITLHTLFNLFIMSEGVSVISVMVGVWITILALILAFERVKKIYPPLIGSTSGLNN